MYTYIAILYNNDTVVKSN